jgi:uncharacterized membrane protein (DUF373 family)
MKIFKKIINIVTKLMLPFVVLALMLGMARIILDTPSIFRNPRIDEGFNLLLTNILSMFVVMELLRSLIEYFEIHRLKITFIIDGTIVFILREIMIGSFQHKVLPTDIFAFSLLLFVLGIIRALAILVSPGDSPDV